jgi:hypothetical protein
LSLTARYSPVMITVILWILILCAVGAWIAGFLFMVRGWRARPPGVSWVATGRWPSDPRLRGMRHEYIRAGKAALIFLACVLIATVLGSLRS